MIYDLFRSIALRPKPQRCAIYTRKSTQHNLDLEFNSLDAQHLRGLYQEPGA
jgi:hypothetical protein